MLERPRPMRNLHRSASIAVDHHPTCPPSIHFPSAKAAATTEAICSQSEGRTEIEIYLFEFPCAIARRKQLLRIFARRLLLSGRVGPDDNSVRRNHAALYRASTLAPGHRPITSPWCAAKGVAMPFDHSARACKPLLSSGRHQRDMPRTDARRPCYTCATDMPTASSTPFLERCAALP